MASSDAARIDRHERVNDFEDGVENDTNGDSDASVDSENGTGLGEGPMGRRGRESENLLAEEEAAERLILGAKVKDTRSRFGRLFAKDPGEDGGRRRARRRRRTRHGHGQAGENELMFNMEEGPSSETSSDFDLRVLGEKHGVYTATGTDRGAKSKAVRFVVIHIVIVLVFVALAYGAHWASRARPSPLAYEARTLSNGTHTFLPTTLLVSLDGFRADFLRRGMTPNLNAFLRQGVSPPYMLPSFPSLTFPNHFTLVTGLHPESHGIVGNNFWEDVIGDQFYYTDRSHSLQPEWWAAEPIWVRAEKAGVRTAIHMWPGSEANISGVVPTSVDDYDGREMLGGKVERILSWLDGSGPTYGPGVKATDIPNGPGRGTRPQFLAMYVPNVDRDGHRYGPNSTQMRDSIVAADGMIGALLDGLAARNLTDVVNVVIVSDHGMATTDKSRLVQLEDLIDRDSIAHMDCWPLYGLRLKDSSEGNLVAQYERLLAKSQSPNHKGMFEVYNKTTMPAHYHFNASDRIAPLWIVPRTGYAIVTRDEFNVLLKDSDKPHGANVNEDRSYAPRGIHGYDNEHPLMRAMFAARGPAFAQPQPGSELEPFQNIEVYNLLCDSLGLSPQPNNGTLRLPLKPIGSHQFPLTLDLPDDVALSHELTGSVGDEQQHDGEKDKEDETDKDNSPAGFGEPQPSGAGDQSPADDHERPEIQGGEEASPVQDVDVKAWLQWMKDKFENIKDWAVSTFGDAGRPGGEDDGDKEGGGPG